MRPQAGARLLKKLHVGNGKDATDYRDRMYWLLGPAVDGKDFGITIEYGDRDVSHVLVHVASAINRIPEPNDPRKLGLRGFTIDTIQQTGDIWQDADWARGSYSVFLAYIAQIRQMCSLSAAKGATAAIYPSVTRRAEALWRIPIADISFGKLSLSIRSRAMAEDGRQFHAIERFCEVMIEADASDDPDEWREFLQRARSHGAAASTYRHNMSTVRGLVPFLTRNGYLGMAASEARPGDVVVVFFRGNRIPVVVRPVRKQGHHLVEEAYCDGIMDGEILRSTEAENFFLE